MVVVGIIGIISAIAVPNFVGYQSRAKQAEAKANLRAWWLAENAYFQEKGTYSELLSEIGYSPTRGNRYQYLFAPTCTYEVRSGLNVTNTGAENCITVDQFAFPTLALTPPQNLQPFTYSGAAADPGNPAGLGGTCPQCSIRGVAAGNIDFDTGIDTWVVSTKDGTMSSAGCGVVDLNAPAGIPLQTFNDAVCR